MRLGKREYQDSSCWIRMMADLPMGARDSVRLVHDLQTAKGMQGKGQGTRLLRSVCIEADKDGMTLILMPDSEKLEKWYNGFDFQRVQDEPVLMVRTPKEI